jgi:hypothetical protein
MAKQVAPVTLPAIVHYPLVAEDRAHADTGPARIFMQFVIPIIASIPPYLTSSRRSLPIWSRPQQLLTAVVGAQSWWLWIRN